MNFDIVCILIACLLGFWGLLFFNFQDRVSLHSSCCPETHSVHTLWPQSLTCLHLLGLKVFATTYGLVLVFRYTFILSF